MTLSPGFSQESLDASTGGGSFELPRRLLELGELDLGIPSVTGSAVDNEPVDRDL